MTEKELVGRRARLTRAIQTGMYTIAAGTVVTITRKFGGFDVNGDKCVHCGVGIRVNRVQPDDLELLAAE